MPSAHFCRNIPSKKCSSTSSLSDDNEISSIDDDSISPMPLLQRNKSLTLRRRGLTSKESVRKNRDPLKIERKDSRPTHRRINYEGANGDRFQGDPGKDFNKGLVVPKLDSLPPRPRRTHSMHPSGTCSRKLPERRPSIEPEAVTLPRLLRRPDPPEQICRTVSIIPRMQANQKRTGKDKDMKTQEKTSNDPLCRTFRRTASMPLFGRPNNPKLVPPKKACPDDPFPARRSSSIAKNFSKDGVCQDVWVERILVREGKDPQVFFKSVFSRECKSEPPTGAMNIIYMDDLVKVQCLKGRHFLEPKQRAPSARKNSVRGGHQSKTSSGFNFNPLRRLLGKGSKKISKAQAR